MADLSFDINNNNFVSNKYPYIDEKGLYHVTNTIKFQLKKKENQKKLNNGSWELKCQHIDCCEEKIFDNLYRLHRHVMNCYKTKSESLYTTYEKKKDESLYTTYEKKR